MKKALVMVLVALFLISGCSNNTAVDEKTDVWALVKEIKEDVIVVDEVTYITPEDTEIIEELKLTEQDLINGYYIHNPEEILTEYKLTDETVYNFIDWHNDFVEEGEDRNYSTTKREEFIEYLESYIDSQPKMPFLFEVSGKNVISVTEIMMM